MSIRFDRNGNRTPEYRAWSHMRERCNNPKEKRYADYGGRGITIDSRWDDFEEFLKEVGPRPSPRHQIDRIDNDVGYEPGNVKWSLPQEQMNNRRNTIYIEDVPLSVWAREYGIPMNTLRFRILKGWDLEEAMTVPVRRKRPNGTAPKARNPRKV